jgi:CTP:molybdopterin cytidylyltransferase MocA
VDVKFRLEIQSLEPAVGLRGLLSRHPGDILGVEIEASSILQDIDNKEDYRKARAPKR